jgi:hypothetical protein
MAFLHFFLQRVSLNMGNTIFVGGIKMSLMRITLSVSKIEDNSNTTIFIEPLSIDHRSR